MAWPVNLSFPATIEFRPWTTRAWERKQGDALTGIEAAALKLGQVVAQEAAKSWLARHKSAKRRPAHLSELAGAELASPLTRRKFDHLLEGIALQVTEHVQYALASYSHDVPANEIAAALLAASDTLKPIDLSDANLLDSDVDPDEIARRVRSAVVDASPERDLAPKAKVIYNLAIDQSCRFIVQVVRSLPEFAPRALAELLSRSSDHREKLDELLSRTRRGGLYEPTDKSKDDEFRAEYTRFLDSQLDKLELLGLAMRDRPKLPLSVAYLSLSVSTDGRQRNASAASAARGGRQFFQRDVEERGGVRVEAAIGRSLRTLIRGEAGSGKTTLLDWLAITACRGHFTQLLSGWNGLIPVLVRLRRYVGVGLPLPEQMLEGEARPLIGVMPPGWMHRQLKEGRILLLVDGVDEVPKNERRDVKSWLTEIVDAYPDTHIVVTGRPAAAEAKWLTEQNFSSVVIHQMAASDVRAFLSRWYSAAALTTSLPCSKSELPEAERRLLNQLDLRPHLAALATNPLLCAMLCALNLDTTADLPRNRMELYRSALAMLLDLRDNEREIRGLLDVTEKTVLLRDLAWRLTLANRTELRKSEVEDFIKLKIPSVPSIDLDVETAVGHLLERSGVIREPVPERVDFVHRTFQEYLSASEATEQKHVGTLIEHAHLDSWRETIVMACGHAKREQRTELIEGILDRADSEQRRARALRLLAAGCLETASDIEVRTRERVDSVIQERLIPPRARSEVGSLASMGDRILRYLPPTLSNLSAGAAAATVSAALTTGSPSALPILAKYASDPRSKVQEALLDGWPYYDPSTYATDVLSEAPLLDGRAQVKSWKLLPHLKLLKNLSSTDIDLYNDQPVSITPETLIEVPFLHHFSARVVAGTRGLDFSNIANHVDLETLRLLVAEPQLSNIASLSALEKLDSLILFGVDWLNLNELTAVEAPIQLLALDGLAEVSNYKPISKILAQCPMIALHDARKFREFDLLACPKLTTLMISDCRARQLPRRLAAGIASGAPLNHLELNGSTVTDISPLTRFPIRELSVARTPLEDLSPVGDMPKLRRINLVGSKVRHLEPLRGRNLRVYLSRDQAYTGLDELGPGVVVDYVSRSYMDHWET